MKVFLMLLGLMLSTQVHAQQKSTLPKLSASERKELQDAIKEMEATNPEAAKAMKEMLKKMDQQQPQVVTKVASAPVARFVSPRVRISFKPPTTLLKAGDTADRMLWMKGKKLNDSMLMSPSGSVILLRRKKNQVVVQPNIKKDPFEKVVKALAQHEKAKEDFVKLVDKVPNGFFYFPAVLDNLREFDVVHNEFMKLASNIIELDPESTEQENKELKKEKPDSMIPDSVRQSYSVVKELMKNYPKLDFPEPPARPVDACFRCDSNRIKVHELSLEQWRGEFSKYERELYGKAVKVLQGLDGYTGPEAKKMSGDMDWAMQMSFNRYRHKIEALEKRYGDDFRYLYAIVYENLSLARHQNLINPDESEDAQIFEKLVTYIDKFQKDALKKLEVEKNYNKFLSALQFFSLCRGRQLLTGSSDPSSFIELHSALHRFNRFRLNMEVDFAVSSESIIANGQLATMRPVYVSIGMEGCKYTLYLSETDHENGEEKEYYIPLVATGGAKDQKEENDKWVHYPYSGAKQLMILFPPVTIGLCNTEPDSLTLSLIRFRHDNYMDSAGKFPKAYTIDIMAYANLLLFNAEGGDASVPGMLQIGAEMMRIHTSTATGYNSAILNKMATAYNRVIEMKKQQKHFNQLSASNNVVLQFQAKSEGEEFFSAQKNYTRNGKEWSVTKGLVKVKVTHAPRSASED